MKDVLEFILKNITTMPDDVVIEEVDEEGTTNYQITVNPDDVGRIIGKEGKVIKAIRTIMRVIAIQKGVRVRVSVMSDGDNQSVQEESMPEVTTEEQKEVVVEEPVAQEGDDITVEV